MSGASINSDLWDSAEGKGGVSLAVDTTWGPDVVSVVDLRYADSPNRCGCRSVPAG